MSKTIRRSERRLITVATLWLAIAGCDRPAVPVHVEPTQLVGALPTAEPFAVHWRQAMADIRDFRAQASILSPDPSKLAALRDRIRDRLRELRETAHEPAEIKFLQVAAPGLAALSQQLDRAVEASEKGETAPIRSASHEAGFILEELAELLKQSDL